MALFQTINAKDLCQKVFSVKTTAKTEEYFEIIDI